MYINIVGESTILASIVMYSIVLSYKVVTTWAIEDVFLTNSYINHYYIWTVLIENRICGYGSFTDLLVKNTVIFGYVALFASWTLISKCRGEKEEDQRRADIADEEAEHDKRPYKECPPGKREQGTSASSSKI